MEVEHPAASGGIARGQCRWRRRRSENAWSGLKGAPIETSDLVQAIVGCRKIRPDRHDARVVPTTPLPILLG